MPGGLTPADLVQKAYRRKQLRDGQSRTSLLAFENRGTLRDVIVILIPSCRPVGLKGVRSKFHVPTSPVVQPAPALLSILFALIFH